ncbi:BppU family phage baseplate upper protein [Bacillus thuringiensis]|uniref:BppU family phage baseplate upper protein n=1 Tax=Bacillus thuringiensis TaxID=1428 RepID=UPI001F54C7EB|nr:BppU family phage baseplate upper protein [Bacillus thuringiensis]
MRNEGMTIDVADPVFTKTIRSRQNDKNGLKMTVYVREKGQIIDLTGYVVKYEAMNQVGLFVLDDAQIVDAKNGVFSYTLSSQAVSISDDWTAYFVMEKNTERMSTPDIRITLRRDAKEGNIKIENYISEFDGAMERVKGYRKEIDEANKKIGELKPYIQSQFEATNQKIKEIAPYIDEQYLKTNKKVEELSASIAANGVVKKGGDTMTGDLTVPTLYAGSKTKQAIVGSGTNDVYIGHSVTKKYLQLKDDGTLSYSGKKVGLVEDVKSFMIGFTNLKNGFKNLSDGISMFYGIDQFGYKHVRGIVEGGSTDAGAVIGTLPDFMKPTYWTTVTAVYDTTGGASYSPCAVNIAWNGDIICQTKRSASSFIIINGMYL